MATEDIPVGAQPTAEYTDDNIRHLSDMEHVRTRPGMYIGRLGDGNLPEDGIYVLLKEVVDNSIDEFKMNAGNRIEIDVEDHLRVSVRDYGRGIPQGKLVEAVSVLNTGGKYDSKAFKKSVGLNGVGVKAVNALSSRFEVRSYREGKVRSLVFEKGQLQSDRTEDTQDENGTFIFFQPDDTLFKNYSFPRRHRGNDAPQLHLPQYGVGYHAQWAAHSQPSWSERFALRQYDRRAPLSYRPHEGRGYRDRVYPHQPVR